MNSRKRFMGAILASVLILAACGGNDGEGTSAAQSTESPTEQETTGQETTEQETTGQETTGQETFEPRTLSYATYIPPGDPQVLVVLEWQRRITEATGGAITFENSYAGSLCGVPDLIVCVRDNRVDIGMIFPGYDPSVMPLAMVGSIPFITKDLQAHIDAFYDLYHESEDLRGEFEANNFRLLFAGDSDAPFIVSTEELTSFQDLTGLRVRTTGDVTAALSAAGVSPVATGPGEMYEGLERGVMDAAIFGLQGLVIFRLHEVADYFYDVSDYVGTFALMPQVINLDVWDELEPSVQAIFDEVSEDIQRNVYPEIIDPFNAQNCLEIGELASVFHAPPGDAAEWAAWEDEQRTEMTDLWKERAAGTDVDVDAMLSQYVELYDGRASTSSHESGCPDA